MNTAIRLNTACKTKYSRAKVLKNGLETFSRKKLGFIYEISERESTGRQLGHDNLIVCILIHEALNSYLLCPATYNPVTIVSRVIGLTPG